MPTRIIAFIPLTLVALVAVAAELILTFDSYGPVVFGTRLSDVEKKLGEKAERETGEPACNYLTFKRYPNVTFMVENGFITRADVGKDVPNAFGIKIGTSLADVKKRFPNVIVEPHQYDPKGHYLILKNADRKKAIVMEEGDGKVTDVRGGLIPSAQYVEGCQ